MEQRNLNNDDTPAPRTGTPANQNIFTGLVVVRSPSGTMRVQPEHVILHRTESGAVQPLISDLVPEVLSVSPQRLNSPGPSTVTASEDSIFPDELAEALAVDSGSEDDEDVVDYTEEQIREIFEEHDQEEEEVVIDDDEVLPEGFIWSDDFRNFNGTEEIYTEQPGPHINSTDPLALFTAVWDRSIMERIVHETNEYAWQCIVKLTNSEDGIGPNSRLHDWAEVNVEEMYKFLSILIYMGLCYRSKLDEYWTLGVLEMTKFRKIMSKNRFFLILRFLHFVNNLNLDNNVHGHERKVSKIAPIVAHCNQKFNDIYTPKRHISLDESLLLWKGRLSWVQCIRTKSARFGIKSYELCEAETGYLLHLSIYTGKSTDFSSDSVHGFTAVSSKVVLKIMENYLHKGHCLVTDNYYNSVSLTRFLKQNGTDLIGTLNRRRTDTPAIIKSLSNRGLPRGTVVAQHCKDVSVLSWMDVKLVTMVSTFHNADTAPGTRAGVNIDKPLVVHSYNKYMGGVDLKDQKLSMYLLERKRGLKWYVKVFRRLLNVSILNAFIIYRSNTQGLNHQLTHRSFRFALSESLSKQHTTQTRIRSAALVMCGDEVRLDGSNDHYPGHIESDDRASARRVRYKRGRCARCLAQKKRTEGNVICTKCNVFLCIGRCWLEYHTEQQII